MYSSYDPSDLTRADVRSRAVSLFWHARGIAYRGLAALVLVRPSWEAEDGAVLGADVVVVGLKHFRIQSQGHVSHVSVTQPFRFFSDAYLHLLPDAGRLVPVIDQGEGLPRIDQGKEGRVQVQGRHGQDQDEGGVPRRRRRHLCTSGTHRRLSPRGPDGFEILTDQGTGYE